MSKLVRYPNGYVGVASDKAAEILAQKPGHCIVTPRPGTEEARLLEQQNKEKGATK